MFKLHILFPLLYKRTLTHDWNSEVWLIAFHTLQLPFTARQVIVGSLAPSFCRLVPQPLSVTHGHR